MVKPQTGVLKHYARLFNMKNIYGYILNGEFVETGFTEKGAKIAAKIATKNDPYYKDHDLIVGYRSPINNMFIQTGSFCHIMQAWLKTVYL